MTPEERQEFEQLKETVRNLRELTDPQFFAALDREFVSTTLRLNDLEDVTTSGVTNNQVLKYDSTTLTWEPADDLDT